VAVTRVRYRRRRRGTGLGRLAGVLLLLALVFAWGYLSHRDGLFPQELIERGEAEGRALLGLPAAPEPAPPVQEPAPPPAPPPRTTGVTVHVSERAFPGMNFRVSARGPEASLLDMEGNVLHRWQRSYPDSFPDQPADGRPGSVRSWRAALLLPNGDLLALFDGYGLVRLDRSSALLWAHPCPCHDGLAVDADGRVHVLDDGVSILSGDTGEVLGRVSLREAFERSPFAALLEAGGAAPDPDTLRADSIQILDTGGCAVSLPDLGVTALLDLGQGAVVAAIPGLRGRAAALPVQRLANGNNLVTEPFAGRAIEVAPDETVVWEYVEPGGGLPLEPGAGLRTLVRVPPERVTGWLAQSPPGAG
jgi:hypothetical protein